MADLNGFDADEHDPNIPAGEYRAMIINSEMCTTKAGDGRYLKLTFSVIDGPRANQQFWHMLNLDNPNATAVQIAKGQLAAICKAVNVLKPKDSAELHNLPMLVTLKIKDNQNAATNFKTAAAGAPVPATPTAQPQQQAPGNPFA